MDRSAGIVLVVVGSAAGLAVGFLLRTRLRGRVVFGLLAAAGATLGAGALLVQRHAGVPDWVAAVGTLALLVPLHVRVILGPLGAHRRRRAPGRA